MSDPLINRIVESPSLPSLPAVAVRVLELARQPDVAIKELASTVSVDQAMAGKILKSANSSSYGLAVPVASIDRAMAYIGINAVKTLVLSFSLIDRFGKTGMESRGPAFDVAMHWRRAIYSATAARMIAEILGEIDADDAFMAAMLQDVGVLAMFVELGGDYTSVIDRVPHSGTVVAEQNAFGIDHTMVGEALCNKWRIPEALCAAVRDHHGTIQSDSETHDIATVVKLAGLAAEALFPNADGIALKRLQNQAQRIPILQDRVDEIIRQTAAGGDELSKIFRMDTGEAVDPDEVLAAADELLVQHQMMAYQRTSELERANSELRKASETDSLTGAYNRAFFDTALGKQFDEANANDSPLALLFFDADRFKILNDTHGHAAGDAILVQLASRASESIGDAGTVCRYGGEEFAVIMPDRDRKAAGIAAERLRRAIEAAPFDVRGTDAQADELPVTISIGVAAFNPAEGHRFAKAEQLLLAADKAVYAAKHAGRNCVRVFSPKIGERESKPLSPQPPRQHQSNPSVRMLLVEDDTMHAMLIAMIGKTIPGLSIDIVGSGEDAIKRLSDARDTGHLPDAILSDLGLPGISGYELLAWVRAELPGDMPVVVVTGTEDRETIDRCMRSGASAFIGKATLCEHPKQSLLDIIEEWCVPHRTETDSRAA